MLDSIKKKKVSLTHQICPCSKSQNRTNGRTSSVPCSHWQGQWPKKRQATLKKDFPSISRKKKSKRQHSQHTTGGLGVAAKATAAIARTTIRAAARIALRGARKSPPAHKTTLKKNFLISTRHSHSRDLCTQFNLHRYKERALALLLVFQRQYQTRSLI